MTASAATGEGDGRGVVVRWWHDLALGVRLAVGGGRTSLARLVLGTVGIGLAVLVLLVAASVPSILAHRDVRAGAASPSGMRVAGVDPLHLYEASTDVRGTAIRAFYLHRTGPRAPLPPGVVRVPDPGEMVVSPGLASLLAGPDGPLLRPRLAEYRTVGTIGQDGLTGPADLLYYAGLAQDPPEQSPQRVVYRFGVPVTSGALNPILLMLVVIGGVALLVPIFIMVAVSSRIAGAQRDRRLAALRLVGAGPRQVRRIAAGESLVSAATGLLLGVGLFFLVRLAVPGMSLFGYSAFTSDVAPAVGSVVLIVLAVPVLAVGGGMVALRRTVIEPLGVLRGGRPSRRRLWWRFALIAFGVALLFVAGSQPNGGSRWTAMVVLGASALLIGVPVLLPWLLEVVVGRLRGGRPSWQLAVRRLQLDSGTPARVVGGVAVVLAGAIAVQTVLVAVQSHYGRTAGPGPSASAGWLLVESEPSVASDVTASLARDRTLRGVYPYQLAEATVNPKDRSSGIALSVAPCTTIRRLAAVSACVDGDVFTVNQRSQVWAGTTYTFVSYDGSGNLVRGDRFTVRADARRVAGLTGIATVAPVGQLLVTPGALRGATPPAHLGTWTLVSVDPGAADAIDYVRNDIGAHPLQAFLSTSQPTLTSDQRTFATIRNLLIAAALFTILLAGVSLLVLALEQVRERRRPLAMLSAAGVRRAVLARSLLWQTAVPVVVGVVAAVGTGIGLAALVLRMTHLAWQPDWGVIGLLAAAAVVLALVVTGATLPSLRGATRLGAMRTE